MAMSTRYRIPQHFASQRSAARSPAVWLGAAAALAACAWWVRHQTRRVQTEHPPQGRFVEVDGVRLHVMERGDPEAPPLVLLHGNGATAEELVLSGLVARAAVRYRVLVFDRPGYGHSSPPPDWDPPTQARLLLGALRQLGVAHPALVFGHSWGSLVALAMALEAPHAVRALVLASGYYHPGPRLDVPWMAAPALPLVGTLMRHTVSPLLSRLLWPLFTRRMFWPREVTEPFRSDYPKWMSLRPGQLQASATESALMIPWAMRLRSAYGEVQVPAVIVAGEKDRMVSTGWHARWLHRTMPGSELRIVPEAGHMVHHVATHEVLKAIDEAARRASPALAAVPDRSVVRTRPLDARVNADTTAPAAAGSSAING